MPKPFFTLMSYLVGALVLCVACTADREISSIPHLEAEELEGLDLVSTQPFYSLRWPQFLLVAEPRGLLWGYGGDVLRLDLAEGKVHSLSLVDPARGFDRLVSADRRPDGTLALLDASGRVLVWNTDGGDVHRFTATPEPSWGGLALSGDHVYLMSQGEDDGSPAVRAFAFDGTPAGNWGDRSPSALIQASLNGGGITSCPDGTVYYSYINSPQILRLGADGRVEEVGEARSDFRTLTASSIRGTAEDGRRLKSVTPLVQLGLGTSRVMSLHCSAEGLLFRHIADPAPPGSLIEVWDSLSGELLGAVHPRAGVLLDVDDQVLYLGSVDQEVPFRLERLHYAPEDWKRSHG